VLLNPLQTQVVESARVADAALAQFDVLLASSTESIHITDTLRIGEPRPLPLLAATSRDMTVLTTTTRDMAVLTATTTSASVLIATS